MRYIDLSAGLRLELELVFDGLFAEIRREFEKQLSSLEKEVYEEGEEPPTSSEILDDVLDHMGDAAPLGFVEFLDALDLAGWDLVRRPPLTTRKKSAKTRKPRVKKLLEPKRCR